MVQESSRQKIDKDTFRAFISIGFILYEKGDGNVLHDVFPL